MLKKLIFTVCVVLSFNISAEIVEIAHIEEIRPYVIKDSLILFDVDETLIATPFSLGSSQWRSWAKTKLPTYKIDFQLFDALTLYIAQEAPYRTVESTTSHLISELQNDLYFVFGFTARGRSQWYSTNIAGVDQLTVEQLENVRIDFNSSDLPEKLEDLDSPYFYEGIIFSEHYSKGDLLKHLLLDNNYSPSLILFVDDKRENAQSIDTAARELGIPCIAFWYRRSELDGANFNPNVANVQLEKLLKEGILISDKDASEIAKTMTGVDPKVYLTKILDTIDIRMLTPKIEVKPELSEEYSYESSEE